MSKDLGRIFDDPNEDRWIPWIILGLIIFGAIWMVLWRMAG